MKKEFGLFAGAGCIMWVVALILNLAFWGGLIWLGFFLAGKYL